ncbi:MAG: hypothetical protein OHK0046_44680 [Anaerolineae bacterium]
METSNPVQAAVKMAIGFMEGNDASLAFIVVCVMLLSSLALVLVSHIPQLEMLQDAVLLVMAGGTFYGGKLFHDEFGGFLLGLTIEFLGAVVTLWVLSHWTENRMLRLSILGLLFLGIPIALIVTHGIDREFGMGLLTELCGALVIFIVGSQTNTMLAERNIRDLRDKLTITYDERAALRQEKRRLQSEIADLERQRARLSKAVQSRVVQNFSRMR